MYWFSRLDKKEKATVNLKNTDGKCFQYATTIALNFEEIKWKPETVSSIEWFTNKKNWNGIKHSSKIDDWKTLEKINPTISLNILYTTENKIPLAYILKTNSNCEKKLY